MNPLSVTELNNQIKSVVETSFVSVIVEGEISNLVYHNSGHIYFSIKDERSVINCVLFRGNRNKVNFKLENNQKVIVFGAITIYIPRGSYQIICTKIEIAGIGNLAVRFEQLKKKFKQEGLFNQKRPLPKNPNKIILITSDTGAAIEDMKRIASNRYPLTKFILIPTIVQGKEAINSIVNNINLAQSIGADLIIIARGGGSLEDLWAFNEEEVCKAIFNSKIPTISAIGHESDVLLSDFVADKRASTPSNAIEIALPDKNELMFYIAELQNRFYEKINIIFNKKNENIKNLIELFKINSIYNRVLSKEEEIKKLKEYFNNLIEQKINSSYADIKIYKNSFDNIFNNKINYTQKELMELSSLFKYKLDSIFLQKEQEIKNLKNRFLLTKKQDVKKGLGYIYKNNKPVELEKLSIGDDIKIENTKVSIIANVKSKTDI